MSIESNVNISTKLNNDRAAEAKQTYQSVVEKKKEAPKENAINTKDTFVPTADFNAKKEEAKDVAPKHEDAAPGVAPATHEDEHEELNDNVKNNLANLQASIASYNPASEAPAAPNVK